MDRSRLTRGIGAVAALLLAASLGSSTAHAVGGDGFNAATQVSKDTEVCQKTLAKSAGKLAAKRAKAISDCLDAVLKCDQQPGPAQAAACRRKLLVAGRGRCATGKVDEGAATLGFGAAQAAAAQSGSKAALVKELNKYTGSIKKKCIDKPAELADPDTGLGFGVGAADEVELSDLTNQSPAGAGCVGNSLVLASHPLAEEILDVVRPLDGTCVAVDGDSPPALGTQCATDADCNGAGGSRGSCGSLAHALRDGELTACSGEYEFPDEIDDTATIEINGVVAEIEALIIDGPSFEIERVPGPFAMCSGGTPASNDDPGPNKELGFTFEYAGPEEAALQNYFDTYVPGVTNNRVITLIVDDNTTAEAFRVSLFEYEPVEITNGTDGRKRYRFENNQFPNFTMAIDKNPGISPTNSSNNPATDKRVEIGVVTPANWYPAVEVDEVARTITLTVEYAEAGEMYDWAFLTAIGQFPNKQSGSIIEEVGGVEVSRRNYFEMFPIRYELLEGFGLSTKIRERIVIAFLCSEDA